MITWSEILSIAIAIPSRPWLLDVARDNAREMSLAPICYNMKQAVISGGGWICEIFCTSVDVKAECRFTIAEKWELRAPKEKCFRAVEVFGLAIPIVRSSCHRPLLDCAFVGLLSRYLLFGGVK